MLLIFQICLGALGLSQVFCLVLHLSMCSFQAYFLRTIHTDPNEWINLMIITNKWHMPRVKAIFTTIFRLPRHAQSQLPSSSSSPSPSGSCDYILHFEEVADLLEPSVLKLREARESQSLHTFTTQTAHMLHSLPDAHRFLFLRHGAYSSERLTDAFVGETIIPALLESY